MVFSYRGVIENGILVHEVFWLTPAMSHPDTTLTRVCLPPGINPTKLSSLQKTRFLQMLPDYTARIGGSDRIDDNRIMSRHTFVIPSMKIDLYEDERCWD